MRHRLPLLIAALLPLACASGPRGPRGEDSPIAGAGAVIGSGTGPRAPMAGSPVGRPLPSVTVTTLDGNAARVSTPIDGRPALVVLWATWCEACVEELPALHRLARGAQAAGAVLLSVSVGEPRDKVAEFVRRESMDWPQLVDEPFQFSDAAGQSRVPAVLVVSAEGNVVFAGGKLDPRALAALASEIERGKARTHR